MFGYFGYISQLYVNNFLIEIICDWFWEKGHIRANNDFSV